MSAKLIRKVLGKDGYIELTVESVSVTDDLNGSCQVSLLVSGDKIDGNGVGLVDAIFNGLKNHYAREYESLNSISLKEFHVGINRKKSSGQGTDALCKVEIEVYNSNRNVFDFSNSSRSLTASAAASVAKTVEFFVNSERAFIAVSRALEDARERGRHDLVTRFTAELSQIVKSTSYTSTIAGLQKKLNL